MNTVGFYFIIGFVLISLISLFFKKKIRTIRQYTLGSKKFSTSTIAMTIVATWISGDYFFITLEEVYTTGLLYALGCLGIPFSLFITGYFFSSRMQGFLGEVSIASFMGKAYGKRVRAITLFCSSILSTGYLIVQFKVLQNVFNIYFGEDAYYLLLILLLTTTFYISFGGIGHVTTMDRVQSFVFFILIILICGSIFSDVDYSEGVNFREVLSNNHRFNIKNFLDIRNVDLWNLLWLFTLFSIPEIDPSYFQRIAISSSSGQIKISFYLASLVVAIILFAMSFVGFLLFSFSKNLDPKTLIPYVMNVYSYTPLKDLFFISLIIMSTSTIDSIVNATSAMIAHDCHELLNMKTNQLFIVRIASIILICIAFCLSTIDFKMLQIVFMVQSFYVPIIIPPLFMKMFNFNVPVKIVYISMFTAFISVLIWKNLFICMKVEATVPATAINFLVIILYLYFKDTKLNEKL